MNEDNNIKMEIIHKLDDKYKRVPKGYSLKSIEDDYGIVSRNGNYYLIDSKGDFVKGPFEKIEQVENNCYMYQNRNASGIIENGKIIKNIKDNEGTLSSYLGNGLFNFIDSSGRLSVIRKDGKTIIERASSPIYDDGKIFFQDSWGGNSLSVSSDTGKRLGSFETDFGFSIQACMGGNCLIRDIKNGKYYGVDLLKNKLVEINVEKLMTNIYDVNYYVFYKDGEQIILDSNFEVIKKHISPRISVSNWYYSCFNAEDKEYCIMDFDDNVLYNHVKWISGDGVMQVGDDKIYDGANKKEINIVPGLKVLSWNRDLENNSLLFVCRDDNDILHLTDFDSINIEVSQDKIKIGNKYAVINDTIIPIADLKTLKYCYELTVESDGEIIRRGFNARSDANKVIKKLNEDFNQLEKEHSIQKRELKREYEIKTKQAEEQHRVKIKTLIKNI